MISGKSASVSRVRLGPWRWVVRSIMTGYILLTSVLPFCALVMVALQPYWQPHIDLADLSMRNFAHFLGTESLARRGLVTSVLLGLAGATIGMGAAALISAYGRTVSTRWAGFIDGAPKIPGAFSHIVIGVAFLLSFSVPPVNLSGTFQILIMAYVVVNMPQASIAARNAVDQVGQELIDASTMSGSAPGRTFRNITFPLMIPGLVAGWALLFVLMVGDLTVSAILAGSTNPVVGFVFLDIYDNGTFSELASLGTLVCVITTAVVATVIALARPRYGAIGSGG